MNASYASQAIQAVQDSLQSFCKFLSANDTGATGGHQSGILISKTASEMMFSQEDMKNQSIAKRTVKICWQDDFSTDSAFTYYTSKNELRVTRFGRGFPFLQPDKTGSLFILCHCGEDDYKGYFLETDDEIETFLAAFAISPAETNRLIDISQITSETKAALEISKFADGCSVKFPSTAEMSAAARAIEDRVYNHAEYVRTNPDEKIIKWVNVEYALFRAVEHNYYEKILKCGFSSVDDFIKTANGALNRRKSRAGKSLEHHLSAIFDGNALSYSAQAVTEGKKKPDFIFPSLDAYNNQSFPDDNLLTLAAKTTCKDRWRQILNEAGRLRDRPKYLFTLQQGISAAQMKEMEDEKVILVVPKPYITAFPPDCRCRLWTLAKFVSYAQTLRKS